MSTPASRSLPIVLRALVAGEDQLRLLVGAYGPPSPDPTYANVVLDGQAIRVPKLAGVIHGSEGQPAYILAAPGRMIVLGTVSN